MIFESTPWRRDLLRDADILARWLSRNVSEKRSVLIEKKVFIGAYSIRKLLDSEKLSSDTGSRLVEIDRFPNIKKVTKYERRDITKHYSLYNGVKSSLTIRAFSNCIIHSFIFNEFNNDRGHDTSLIFTSDMMKDKWLYSVNVETVIKVMRFVAKDIPQKLIIWRDPNTGISHEWRGSECDDLGSSSSAIAMDGKFAPEGP